MREFDQEWLGQEDWLRRALAVNLRGSAHAFVEDSLMSAMLVDQVKPGLPFEQQKASRNLPDQTQWWESRGDDQRRVVPDRNIVIDGLCRVVSQSVDSAQRFPVQRQRTPPE